MYAIRNLSSWVLRPPMSSALACISRLAAASRFVRASVQHAHGQLRHLWMILVIRARTIDPHHVSRVHWFPQCWRLLECIEVVLHAKGEKLCCVCVCACIVWIVCVRVRCVCVWDGCVRVCVCIFKHARTACVCFTYAVAATVASVVGNIANQGVQSIRNASICLAVVKVCPGFAAPRS